MGDKKRTVCVDFDGVIHSYTSPWVAPHLIPDPPVDGALKWMREMLGHFQVLIFSTRCRTWRGRRAMRRWLWRHDTGENYPYSMWQDNLMGSDTLSEVKFSKNKPPALIYLDDRAVRFTGPRSWPTVNEIHKAKPWNKS